MANYCVVCGKEIPPPELRWKRTHKKKTICSDLCARHHKYKSYRKGDYYVRLRKETR